MGRHNPAGLAVAEQLDPTIILRTRVAHMRFVPPSSVICDGVLASVPAYSNNTLPDAEGFDWIKAVGERWLAVAVNVEVAS